MSNRDDSEAYMSTHTRAYSVVHLRSRCAFANMRSASPVVVCLLCVRACVVVVMFVLRVAVLSCYVVGLRDARNELP